MTRTWQDAIATTYSTQNDVALTSITADCWANPAQTCGIWKLLAVSMAELRCDRISARLNTVASISGSCVTEEDVVGVERAGFDGEFHSELILP